MKLREFTAETLEDLIALTIAHNTRQDDATKYTLEFRTGYDFENKADGEAWHALQDGPDVPRYGDADYAEWKRNWREIEPKQVRVESWHLSAQGDRNYRINLSEKVAKQLDAIWTKRVPNYSTMPQRVGALTLAGMLKRLEKTDTTKTNKVAALILAARTAQENKVAAQNRNWERKQIGYALDALNKALADANDLRAVPCKFAMPTDISFFSDLAGLRELLALESDGTETTAADLFCRS